MNDPYPLKVLSDHRECTDCDLSVWSSSPGVGGRWDAESREAHSNTDALIYIGRNPGFHEDKKGHPFVGKSGTLLREVVVRGPHFEKAASVYYLNAVRCHLPSDEPPATRHFKACAPHTARDLSRICGRHRKGKKIVVLLGGEATASFFKFILGVKGMTLTKGMEQNGSLYNFQPYPENPKIWKIHIFCTYHPAYLLRTPGAINTVAAHNDLMIDCIRGTMATPSSPKIVPVRNPPCHPLTL